MPDNCHKNPWQQAIISRNVDLVFLQADLAIQFCINLVKNKWSNGKRV